MNTLVFELLNIIKTKEDKIQFLKQLEKISQTFFAKENDLQSLLQESIPYGKRQKILHMAHNQHVDITSVETMQTFIEELKSLVIAMPEITITFAIEPTEVMITGISSWFAVNLKKPMILDIVVNTTLIGGIILHYQGIYKDFSVKKKLQE